MMYFSIVIFSLLFFLFPQLDAYKILISSPSLSRSHMIMNSRVADALARDGHDVTVMEVEYFIPLDSFSNHTKLARSWPIPGKFFHYEDADAQKTNLQSIIVRRAFQPLTMMNAITNFHFFGKFMQLFNSACENLLTTQGDNWERLRAEKFDLIIGEQIDFCAAGLAHLLHIPTYVLLNSCPLQENIASILGLPTPSSWVPTLQSDNTDKMGPLDRLRNFLRQLFVIIGVGPNAVQAITAIYRKHFGEDFPDILDIIRNSPFVFVNADEFLDFPRPILPNIVYIGGLGLGLNEEKGQKEGQPAAVELEINQFGQYEPFNIEMSKGAKGAILFSLGSIVKSTDLPEEFRRNVFEGFRQLPDYHFIVRADKEDNFTAQIANGMDNVFLANWLPQVQILRHPRLKLFISHGGYNSLMEAASAGIPLMAMAFFADQYRNARVVERNGWGLAFDKLLMMEGSQEFTEAIGHLLREEKYKSNAKRIKRLIQTKPFSAEERLQKSVRFLAENGGKMPELLPESRLMSTMALYNLDLIGLAIIAASIAVALIVFLAKCTWRWIRGKGREKSKHE